MGCVVGEANFGMKTDLHGMDHLFPLKAPQLPGQLS